VRERVRGLLEVTDQDTPVAELLSDSLLDEVATDSDLRVVRFARPNGDTATVATSLRPGALAVEIEVAPPMRATICARYTDGSTLHATTDARGRATMPSMPSGLVTFYVVGDAPTHEAWRTAWLRY